MTQGNKLELADFLQLQSVETGSMPLSEFIQKLPKTPEIAYTAFSRVMLAIKKRGLVDIEKEPNLERRDYLRFLQARRIPAWTALDQVRGSQAVAHRIMQHLEAGADNGYQLRQGLLILGGPASGKGFLADRFKLALEGEEVYVVDGCEIHENPINLLRLLPRRPATVVKGEGAETGYLEDLAEYLGLADPENPNNLYKLLATAGDPCRACWKRAMFDKEGNALSKPNLANIQVKKMRLSSRNFGIATWDHNSQGCPLPNAIRQASGGMLDIPELCAVQHPGPGETLQIEALINATDSRKIAETGSCGDNAGFLPVDEFILCQSNLGSWEEFLKGQKDPDKYTRRFSIFTLPYITARVEEECAYNDFVSTLRAKPTFDPLALKLAATLAVLSRLKKVENMRLIDKLRIYSGESFVVNREQQPQPKSASYGGGPFGAFTSESSREAGSKNWTAKDIAEMLAKSDQTEEKEREGLYGLPMSFMLSFISQICNTALRAPKHPAYPNAEPCITSLDMIRLLRQRLKSHSQMHGLTEQQKLVVNTCLNEHLKETETTTDKPGTLELEYRRLLRDQLLSVFAPDFSKRAQDMFVKYRIHARAYGNNETRVKVPGTVNTYIDTDIRFLESIDKGRSLKPATLTDVRAWRGAIDALINDLTFSKGTLVSEDADKVKDLDWTTIPELEKAIEDRIYELVAEKVEKVLKVKPELLSEDDRAFLDKALAEFRDFGYDDISLERALEYAKELKLWAKPQN